MGYNIYVNPGLWRVMLLVAVLPAICLFIGMLRMPESPRWLIERGRQEEAEAVMRQVRDPERADAEIKVVRQLVEEEAQAV